MANDRERLQPTQPELDNTTDKARLYWQSLADEAIARYNPGTIPQDIWPQDILCRVPAMPDSQLDTYKVTLSPSSAAKAIFTATSSTMRSSDNASCDIGNAVKSTKGAVLLGV